MVPFDWYYFDISTPDGRDLVITYHVRPFTTAFDISIVDVFLYHNGRQAWHRFFPLPLRMLHATPGEVTWDEDNAITFSNDGVHFRAKHQEFAIRGRFQQPVVPDEMVELNLLTDSDQEKYFKWQLRLPRAPAQVEVQVDGQQLAVSGQGYHDRNFGNVFLGKEIASWRWGKFYFPDYMMILGEVVERHRGRNTIVVEVKKRARLHPRAQLQWDAATVTLQLPSGAMSLEKVSSSCLDDIRFFAPHRPSAIPLGLKFRELMGFYLQRLNVQPLIRRTANARYRRLKETYVIQGQSVRAFVEEMNFDG